MRDQSTSKTSTSPTSSLGELTIRPDAKIREVCGEQNVLSRLSHPSRTSSTHGFVAGSLERISAIFDVIAGSGPHNACTTECLSELKTRLHKASGDFQLTLQDQTAQKTPFAPQYQRILVTPFLPGLWRVTLGDGLVSPQLHKAIRLPVISTKEHMRWALQPIPDTRGIRAFSASAAARVLRDSRLFDQVVDDPGSRGPHGIQLRHHGEIFSVDLQVVGQPAPRQRPCVLADREDLVVFNPSSFQMKAEYQPQFAVTVYHSPPRAPFAEHSPQRMQKLSDNVQSLTVTITEVIGEFFGKK